MPNIKKAEYERLKMIEGLYDEMFKNFFDVSNELDLFKKRLKTSEECRSILTKTLRSSEWDRDRWRRSYNAISAVFKIEEFIETPSCFNLIDSIQYIMKKQEEQKGS